MYGRQNIFSNNSSNNTNNYNSSSNNNSSGIYRSNAYSYSGRNNDKLGTYRTQYKYERPPEDVSSLITIWRENPPLTISSRMDVLHLTPTQIRVQDYYLMRNKKLTSLHQDKLKDAVRKDCFNEELLRTNCYNLLPFSNDRPFDYDSIKAVTRNYSNANIDNSRGSNTYNNNNSSSNNIFSRNSNNNSNSYGSSGYNNNYNNNSSYNNNNSNNNTSNNNIFASNNNSSSNNIFSRNSNSNSYGNNINNNNSYGNNNNSSNNSNSGSANIFNTRNSNINNSNNNQFNNSGGNNIFNNSNNNGGSNLFNNNNNNSNASNNIFNNNRNSSNNNIFNNNNSNNNSNNNRNIFSNGNNNNSMFNNNNNNSGNMFNNNNYGNNLFNNNNNNINNNIFDRNNNNNMFANQGNYGNAVDPYFLNELQLYMKNVNEVVKKLNINIPSIQAPSVPAVSQPKQSIFARNEGSDSNDYDLFEAQRKNKKRLQNADATVTLTEEPIHSSNHKSSSNEQKKSQMGGSYLKTTYQNYIKNTNSAIFSNQSNQAASKLINQNYHMSQKKVEQGSLMNSNIIKRYKVYDVKEQNYNGPDNDEQIYNGPCKCWLKIKIYWLDNHKNIKLPTDFKFIADLQSFQPNNHLWKQALIQRLKQENPIVRSDATIQMTFHPRQQLQNKVHFDIVGIISQKIFNLQDYDINYDQILNNHVIGLKVGNQHGTVIWHDPIDLLSLDFKVSQFSIQNAAIIVCTDSPLNCKCLVQFNKLPDDTRKMIQNDGNQTKAFQKLSKKVEKASDGNFKLIDIKIEQNKQIWQMQVTRFP